jgi:hypothetical protein
VDGFEYLAEVDRILQQQADDLVSLARDVLATNGLPYRGRWPEYQRMRKQIEDVTLRALRELESPPAMGSCTTNTWDAYELLLRSVRRASAARPVEPEVVESYESTYAALRTLAQAIPPEHP